MSAFQDEVAIALRRREARQAVDERLLLARASVMARPPAVAERARRQPRLCPPFRDVYIQAKRRRCCRGEDMRACAMPRRRPSPPRHASVDMRKARPIRYRVKIITAFMDILSLSGRQPYEARERPDTMIDVDGAAQSGRCCCRERRRHTTQARVL